MAIAESRRKQPVCTERHHWSSHGDVLRSVRFRRTRSADWARTAHCCRAARLSVRHSAGIS